MGDDTESAGWWVGVDVGGTFTDVVAVHGGSGELRAHKVLTTHNQEEAGVLAAVESLQVSLDDVREIVHGHTVGINAVLNRTGATTGLLATAGHRDLLDIGRLNRYRPRMYDPTWLRPHQDRPIVQRNLRVGVPERIGWDGSEVVPLDEGAVRAAAANFRDAGVESIAICFINSYISDTHEERAAEIVRSECPDAYVQTSSIYPVTKEHERTTTVVLDAYVGRAVARYLQRLNAALRGRGFPGALWIMMMNGGVRTAEEAAKAAVFQLQSGPTGGVAAAAHVARTTGRTNLLTMDVGGTSTDVAAVSGGTMPLTDVWSVEHGLTLTLPLVDVGSIGSGAGSIISFDSTGSLRVGPESAGSSPGPACYGKGGMRPTLTDACVVLGLLQPDQFAGGSIPLDVDLAVNAFKPLLDRTSLTLVELAEAAYHLAASDIAGSLRGISTYRGLDLREYSLLAFGAAGPMLAAPAAADLGISRITIPPNPGQFSAFGMLCSDARITVARSPMRVLDPSSADALELIFTELEASVGEQLSRQGVSDHTYERAMFVMYAGQTWDNRLPVSGGLDAERVPALYEGVHEFYQSQYGYSARELPVVVTTLEVTGMARRPVVPQLRLTLTGGDPLLKRAPVRLAGVELKDVCFYDRMRMPADSSVTGPAVIVDPYSTIVVPPDADATVDADSFITMQVSS